MTLGELVEEVIRNRQDLELLKEKMLELIEVMQEITQEIKSMRGEE